LCVIDVPTMPRRVGSRHGAFVMRTCRFAKGTYYPERAVRCAWASPTHGPRRFRTLFEPLRSFSLQVLQSSSRNMSFALELEDREPFHKNKTRSSRPFSGGVSRRTLDTRKRTGKRPSASPQPSIVRTPDRSACSANEAQRSFVFGPPGWPCCIRITAMAESGPTMVQAVDSVS
jgi:hypothetical protein